jgi:predicted ATPase/DNA-binding XRE family transcriptional regulator
VGEPQGGHAAGFGSRVRTLRIAAGLTQGELAERAAVSERSISDLERGVRRTVYPATARQLAAALSVGTYDLSGFLSEARTGLGLGTGKRDEIGAIPADHRARIPIPLTRLLGREPDLALALSLVRDPEVRLVTIVGPGGIGKTRLAVEVANHAAEGFAGGSYFVSLSASDDPAMVLPLLATAVGVAPESGDLQAALARRFVGEPTMVVLDTFEHVVAVAPAIGEMLAASPALTVLATSRTPLHLRGEREVPLQPLRVGIDPDHAGRAPAVELFLERAAAVEPGFESAAAAVEVITDICARLDGLPLAIELAAARVRHMPLGDLRRQLEHRLDPLVGGARDLPARQQTMRRTLDWSYALLGPAEMRLFRSIAAFRGGFGLDAVVEMLQPSEATGGTDLMSSLTALVDSSLVLVGSGASGEARYRLLDVTREYAVERSAAAGEFAGLRRRHADYFLALAERAEPGMRAAHQREWYSRLLDDEGNFRSALKWALDLGEADIGLRLAGALWMFWRWAGLFAEGRAWLEAALLGADGSSLEVRCQGIWGAGWLAYHQDDYKRTGELGTQMLGMLAGTDDDLLRRNGLTLVGNAALAEGRGEEAVAALEEALAICESGPPNWHLATSLLNLGTARLHGGRAVEAGADFGRALAIYDELGDQHFAARTLIQVGYSRLLMADSRAATDPIRRAMELVAEIGDAWGIAEGLEAVATLRSESDPRVAALLAGAAERLRERISMRQHPADAIINRRHLQRAQELLTAQAFQLAWADGRGMALKDAVDLALPFAPS